ncbi:MAG TPA: hypothetical protein DCM87_14295 [Planctomycetes bacterium]|nr:hypothetical protein [Planctomycetota bacterium]
MRGLARAGTAGAAVCAVLGAAGCYTVGVVPPPGVNRILVPFVANETFPYEREIEYDMTRELRRQIEVQSPCVPVTDEANADAALRVTVKAYRQNVVAEDRLDRPVYAHAEIDVHVDFRRVGGPDAEVFFNDTLHDRFTFRTDAGFEAARRDIVRRVADRILAEVLTAWDER